MRQGSIKSNRVNGEVRKALSSIIRNVKDPRVSPMASITDAEVTPDLKFCKAYVSVLGSDKEKEDTITGLESAKGYIRRELARTVNLRITPEIFFELDNSVEYGMKMDKIMKDLGLGD